jgi:hypothetical protein
VHVEAVDEEDRAAASATVRPTVAQRAATTARDCLASCASANSLLVYETERASSRWEAMAPATSARRPISRS